MFYKRRVFIFIIVACLATIFAFGCSQPTDDSVVEDGTFSIHFIDVGQGECIFARFSDGKVMLVDCGPKDEQVADDIISFLQDAGVEKIDYFVITHPDSDHCGNAVSIMKKFNIGTVYLPDIIDEHLRLYPLYNDAELYIRSNGISVNRSDCYDYIKGEDYRIAFLSPRPKMVNGSAYNDFNSALAPTDDQANALSAVIYIEAQGVRCLLTGDIPSKQERFLLDNLHSVIKHFEYFDISVNLQGIDLLKVAHHGADNSSCAEFLTKVCPKKAIISVGGNNFYGHPSTEVLERLYTANPSIDIYRTDVNGTISFTTVGQGEYIVETTM